MNEYDILKHHFGYSEFRYPQKEIIDSILKRQDTIAILPTGGGKSITYQVPALLLDGITIIVTPLISLMEDQVLSLKKRGISAEYINSNLSFEEQKNLCLKLCMGKLKLLYLSPERLKSKLFLHYIHKTVVSLIAIDEAHTISWADSFRREYGHIKDFIASISIRPTILAVTATATPQTIELIQTSLSLEHPIVFSKSVDRKELFYQVIKIENKIRFIKQYLKQHIEQKGIIYCLTRRSVENLSKVLFSLGIKNYIYHGGLDTNIKDENQEKFKQEESGVMIATNAFGMGIDISNIRYVINYEIPSSIEDLVQQMGRASRDGKGGDGIVLFSFKDIQTIHYFIENLETETAKKNHKKQLKKVIEYCTMHKCRHQFISSYFKQNIEKCKNKCDNC
ncbi:MAG: RecQ family ATP-dependent DNA helicase [Anaeroplasmataceae bacterium]|nr:RecQ family ATP-dependent DNA helicase [Anaeroplasmataceae bacterium]